MRIATLHSVGANLDLALSGWTRMGYISRSLKFSDESCEIDQFDHNFELKITALSDFQTVDSEVNSGLSIFPVLSSSDGNIFPDSGKLLGHARSSFIRRPNERPISYLWAEIFFHQDIFESIENSLAHHTKFIIHIDGLQYHEEENDNEEQRLEKNYVITNVSFDSEMG
jgi:hypothetical protein